MYLPSSSPFKHNKIQAIFCPNVTKVRNNFFRRVRIPFLVVSFIGILANSITSKEEKLRKCTYGLDGRAGQVNSVNEYFTT